MARPSTIFNFVPTAADALQAPTSIGGGYDESEALHAIRERYELAYSTLNATLPRVLANEGARTELLRLRQEGWLDWQILVALVNIVWTWRVEDAGLPMDPSKPAVRALQRTPESADTPEVPLSIVSRKALSVHRHVLALAVAQRWRLRWRPQVPDEDALWQLLVSRYQFAVDDLPHRDILDSVDDDGALLDFLLSPAPSADEP